VFVTEITRSRIFDFCIGKRKVNYPPYLIEAPTDGPIEFIEIYDTLVVYSPPPTVRQAVCWIAQLGGFLGRKGDGEPGITIIWRGWSRLADLADLYLITHPSEDTGNR